MKNADPKCESRVPLRLCLVFALWLAAAGGCSKKDSGLAPLPFRDDFEREALGAAWQGQGDWRVVEGRLFSAGTENRPLWLRAALPDKVTVEFDARSESPDGDIKFEIFGDGRRHASGYVLIFGGWKNTISCIARLDEHGADRLEKRERGLVQRGKTYRMKVVAEDKNLFWYIDGELFLRYFDPQPLRGEGHDRFAFNNWRSPLYFDNLTVTP